MATANLNEPTSSADGNIPFIGSAADDGTGNTLREAINRINARLKEIYGAQDGSNVVQTPFVDNDNIKDDSINYNKLGAEFTTVQAFTGTSIDWGAAQVFTRTISTDIGTLSFSSVSTGMVIDLVITSSGSGSLTLPSSVKTVTGTFNATGVNLIQIVSTNGSTEQWATISQEAS